MSELDFNCDCDIFPAYATLGALRRRMMIRLGYAAQADNPTPGMVLELTDYLQSAQTLLYQKNPTTNVDRFFRWTMVPGVRYYGIDANDSQTDFSDISCTRHMDTSRVIWVGLEDLNGAWIPLIDGIDPTYYTTSQMRGLPSNYEIRSCIEIFPPPNDAYKLWIKAKTVLLPFISDSDQTTIPDELVFLLALGNAKSHRGQRDAQQVLQQAANLLFDIKAGTYNTMRYVPGTISLPPAIQPRLIHFLPNP